MWKFGSIWPLLMFYHITAVDLLITGMGIFSGGFMWRILSAKTDASDIWGLQSVDLVRKISGREDKYSVKKEYGT